MSMQAGDFILLRGKIYSVTKDGQIREWFGEELLADEQSQKRDAWLVSAALEDNDQDLNQNRYVNLKNQIQKERNAQYLIFRS